MSDNDIVARPSALDQLLFDLFTTALEGGINYWATRLEYHWAEPSALKHYADGTMVHELTYDFRADVADSEEYDEYLAAIEAQKAALASRETETFIEAFDRVSGAKRAPAVPTLKQYRVNRNSMAQGYRLATTVWRDRIVWSSGEKPPLVVGPDTDWDFDASDADCILQLGLFGKVVYG